MEQNKAERLNENVTEKMCSSDGNVVGEMCSPADADTCGKRVASLPGVDLNLPGIGKSPDFSVRLRLSGFCFSGIDGIIAAERLLYRVYDQADASAKPTPCPMVHYPTACFARVG